MLTNKLLALGCTTVVVSLLAAGTAQAQLRGDKAVYFTFSQPVALPQVTLPAGKYLFRLADSLVNRTIVQVYSADTMKLHAMLMTMPTQRTDLPNDPEIRFLETAANTPPAIRTYWFPGERTGWEFIYPRTEALRLARSSKQPVLTTVQNAATADEMRTAQLARVSPDGDQVAIDAQNEADRQALAGQSQRGEVAINPPQPAVVTSAAPAAASATMAANAGAPRSRLPATASSTPTVMLVGMLALSAALGLGLWRRARA